MVQEAVAVKVDHIIDELASSDEISFSEPDDDSDFYVSNSNKDSDTDSSADNSSHSKQEIKKPIRKRAGSPSGVSSSTDKISSAVHVMVTDNKSGKRKWDKMFYCLFCDKPQKKLPRHLQGKHADEAQVADWVNERDKSKKEAKLTLIRNMGNHKHNREVLTNGEGNLIVSYRPSRAVGAEDYAPCSSCYAYIVRRDLWRHVCKVKPPSSTGPHAKKARRAVSSKLLLPPPPGVSDSLNKVIVTMRPDDITRVVKYDSLILEYGQKLFNKHGHDPHQYNYIRCKLRELGRLVLELRVSSDNANSYLEDFIQPSKFKQVTESVKVIAGYNTESNSYTTPSLALKLGHSLRKCTLISQSKAIESGSADKIQMSKAFMKLMNINWTDEMSTQALRTLSELKRNKPKMLPLANDVRLLSEFLKEKGKSEANVLEKGTSQESLLDSWKSLRDIVLTRLIVFNRRRQGEVAQLTLHEISKLSKADEQGAVTEKLSPLEKKLNQYFFRIEVRGKRGSTVPILLNSETKDWLDLLVSKRRYLEIPAQNPYVFARPHNGSLYHVRGADCLRQISKECGAKQPELLRSTRLRKHIATMSQILNLKEHELDMLARFLGHDIRVHREYYRLPEETLQVAKVSKLLLAMEQGSEGIELGKQLDDITIDPDEGKIYSMRILPLHLIIFIFAISMNL